MNTPSPATPFSIARPSKLSLALLPTPVSRLHRTSDALGINLWLKRDDLSGCLATGNKVRKLEYLLAEALASEVDTVITCGGLQSNHCRATAAMCAQLGLRCELVLRADDDAPVAAPGLAALPRATRTGNLFLSELCGAQITVVPRKEYTTSLPAILRDRQAALLKAGQRALVIPTGGSNAMGLWGYMDAASELIGQCEQQGFRPDSVVCASGSGGTQAGLALGLCLEANGLAGAAESPPLETFSISDTAVVGYAVCDDAQYFASKVKEDVTCWQERFVRGGSANLASLLNQHTNDQYIGPGYAKPYEEMLTTVGQIARTEGVVFDPVYSGKAIHGLLEDIRQGKYDGQNDIVFVHTGGVFGLFAYSADWPVCK